MLLPRQATFAANTTVILRRPFALANGRLEGWKHAPSLWPSFETVTRKRACPPQDDGGVVIIHELFSCLPEKRCVARDAAGSIFVARRRGVTGHCSRPVPKDIRSQALLQPLPGRSA